MKFLLDAQLPPSLRQIFIDDGYDCIHTIDLIDGNNTADKIINKISVAEQRILVTKDSNLFHSYLIKKEPCKLILVKLGNMSKKELIQFFKDHFTDIIPKIKEGAMIVLNNK